MGEWVQKDLEKPDSSISVNENDRACALRREEREEVGVIPAGIFLFA